MLGLHQKLQVEQAFQLSALLVAPLLLQTVVAYVVLLVPFLCLVVLKVCAYSIKYLLSAVHV